MSRVIYSVLLLLCCLAMGAMLQTNRNLHAQISELETKLAKTQAELILYSQERLKNQKQFLEAEGLINENKSVIDNFNSINSILK